MSSRFLAAVTGSAALLMGASATAAEYRVTFLGTVVDGVDQTGVFGDPGSLDGEAFAVFLRYDTLHIRDTEPGVSDLIEPVSASLRIKGVTYALPDSDFVTSFVLAKTGQLSFEHFTAIDADPVDLQSVGLTAFSAGFQPDLEAGFSGAVTGGGSFSLFRCCCPSCGDNFEDLFAGGTLDLDFVSYAVPEPATWGLMIVGFGLAGAGLRRRRAAVA